MVVTWLLAGFVNVHRNVYGVRPPVADPANVHVTDPALGATHGVLCTEIKASSVGMLVVVVDATVVVLAGTVVVVVDVVVAGAVVVDDVVTVPPLVGLLLPQPTPTVAAMMAASAVRPDTRPVIVRKIFDAHMVTPRKKMFTANDGTVAEGRFIVTTITGNLCASSAVDSVIHSPAFIR